jgi:hypothetical protein
MGKQNDKLFKNIEKHEEKKTKQQESEILGQKPSKGRPNKEKEVRMYNS